MRSLTRPHNSLRSGLSTAECYSTIWHLLAVAKNSVELGKDIVMFWLSFLSLTNNQSPQRRGRGKKRLYGLKGRIEKEGRSPFKPVFGACKFPEYNATWHLEKATANVGSTELEGKLPASLLPLNNWWVFWVPDLPEPICSDPRALCKDQPILELTVATLCLPESQRVMCASCFAEEGDRRTCELQF